MVIGSSNTDLISKLENFPKPGETVVGKSFMQAMGGKGGNQALAAHRLGGDVQFVTCLGKDANGENTLKYYKNQNLDVSRIFRVDEVPSGTAMIWVDGKGENSIVINPGANDRFSPKDIDTIEDIIAEAYMVVVQMEIPFKTIERICEMAYENSTKILLNAAPAHKLGSIILKRIDVLVVNETEAEVISGMKISSYGEEAIVDRLRELGPEVVIMTMGKKGCFFKDGQNTLYIPSFKVESVDSTAAGDVFCGAIATELSRGREWVETLEFATAASALCVMRLGAQPSIPNELEVRNFLSQNVSAERNDPINLSKK